MFLLILYVILIILNMMRPKSKILFSVLLVYLWILFGWSMNTADWSIYSAKYVYYDNIASVTEPLFTELIRMGNLVGLDYRGFLIAISGICIIIIGISICLNTENRGFVLGLYTIFSFPIDVTQIRFFVGMSFASLGIKFLLKCKEKFKISDFLLWLVFVIGGSLVHMSLLCLLLLVIPLFFSRYITMVSTIIINIAILLLSGIKDIFYYMIAILIGSGKVNTIMRQGVNSNLHAIIYTWVKIIIIFIWIVVIWYFLKNSKNSFEINKNSDTEHLKIEFMLDANIMILITLGLLSFTVDFYRIQLSLLLFDYIIISNYLIFNNSWRRIRKSSLIVSSICVFVAFLNLYFLVLSNSNLNTVFLPIFYNNVFFNS